MSNRRHYSKKIYETTDGRRFETLEKAIDHACQMRSPSLPEYIWRFGKAYYVLWPNDTAGYVEDGA